MSYKLKSSAAQSNNVVVRNPNWLGPKHEVCRSSIKARSNMIGPLDEYEWLRGLVLSEKLKFCNAFYLALNDQGRTINEQWVDSCKVRDKELSKILAAIICADPDLELAILVDPNRKALIYNINDINYCPEKFAILGANEYGEVTDLYINLYVEGRTERNVYPKMYAPLFKCMLPVALACREAKYCGDAEIYQNLTDLAMSILEIAGLYNETQPDAEHWRKQEESTLKILTNPPTRTDDEEIDRLFEEVLYDIQYSNYEYVKDIQVALKSTRRYRSSSYSDEDYYYSLKSDPAYIPGYPFKQSLLKSIVETDPFAGCPFDEYTGYISHYNKKEVEGYKAPLIKTIHIPNPGKYKTRAIHLAISAIQDRCNYMHRRLKAVLRRIPSDCTESVKEGQEFLLKITSPEYREDHDFNSILLFDWSNATDKMWQVFQERCLSLVFPPPVVEFWHEVSTCEKIFYHKDGAITPYKQYNGQPQGLLNSFDAFAWAHNIIMLMVMALTKRKNIPASEAYRVEGDDSIINSVTNDPNNEVGDAYIRICSWANMEIERSKSTEILCTTKVALGDFAKVKVLDGQYFSPIPERVANRIGSHNGDYYALTALIWQVNHGFPDKSRLIDSLIDFYYGDQAYLAKRLVHSNIMPSFGDEFCTDYTLKEDLLTVKLAFCYAINKIKASFAETFLNDKLKESLQLINKKEQEDALFAMLPRGKGEDLYDLMEDMDHKFNLALERNLDIEDAIKELCNVDDLQAQSMAAVAQMSEEDRSTLKRVVSLIDSTHNNDEWLYACRDEIYRICDDVEFLSDFRIRSIYKRNARDIMVLRRTLVTYQNLYGRTTTA